MLVLKWILIFVLGVAAVVCGLFIWNYVFGVKLQTKMLKQINEWFTEDDDATNEQVGEATCTTTTQNLKQSTSS